jgi:hypothetical protein
VSGLTQPSYNNTVGGGNPVDISRIVHNSSGTNNGNELPTLPPLNSSSPQLKGTSSNLNKQQERWMTEKDKR